MGVIIHGKTNTRLYRIWLQMKNRCNNVRTKRYKDYGGRGIKVCDKWLHDFQAFYDWAMSNGYKDDLTIDRINNDGNYEPANCKWATVKEQNRNSRKCNMIFYKGETHCLKEWGEILNISYDALRSRMRQHWEIEQMLETPVRKHKEYVNRKAV